MYDNTEETKMTPGQERGIQFILDAWEDDVVPAVIVGIAGGKTQMVSELARRLKGYQGDIVYVGMTEDLASYQAPDGVEYASVSKVAGNAKYNRGYYRDKLIILDEFYQYDDRYDLIPMLDNLYRGGSLVVILSTRPKRMVVPEYVRLHTAATWEWTRHKDLEAHMRDYVKAAKMGPRSAEDFRRDFGLIDSSVPIYQLLNGSYLGRRPRPTYWQRVKMKLARLVR